MSTTRLYTEEQVRSMLDKMEVIYSLEDLTPIELPSDEEIENYYGKVYDFGDWEGFKRGTKWMRDKILNN